MSNCYQPLPKNSSSENRLPVNTPPENKSFSTFPRFSKQQGSTIVISLFIIMVLALLGGILMRMISTSSETVSQEVLGTRAYMAANSAMQAELQWLFPLDGTTATCNVINVFPYDFQTELNKDIPGLYDCTASTSCVNYYSDTDNAVEYYRLTSTGKCGSGAMAAGSKSVVKSSRTIQVEARSL